MIRAGRCRLARPSTDLLTDPKATRISESIKATAAVSFAACCFGYAAIEAHTTTARFNNMAPDLAASFRKLMSSDKPANGEAQHVQPKSSSSKAAPPHPLDALSPDEINAVGRAVRLHFSEASFARHTDFEHSSLIISSDSQKTDVKAVKVMYITLIEPPKLDVLRFLGIPTSVDEIGKVQPDHSILISRRAETVVIDAVTGRAYCIQATLSSGGTSIDDVELLPAGVEPGITVEVSRTIGAPMLGTDHVLSPTSTNCRNFASARRLCATILESSSCAETLA